MRNDDRGRGAGDARHVVVLRQPIAAKAPALGMACEVERVAEGHRGIAADDHRGGVEYGKGYHGALHQAFAEEGQGPPLVRFGRLDSISCMSPRTFRVRLGQAIDMLWRYRAGWCAPAAPGRLPNPESVRVTISGRGSRNVCRPTRAIAQYVGPSPPFRHSRARVSPQASPSTGSSGNP